MVSRDKPTPNDTLGFEPYVKGIEALVRSAQQDELPIAIGIYGSWGSGKTSFMWQLKDRLQGKEGDGDPLPTVWFDAWKYDRAQDVRSALIYKILMDLERRSTTSAKDKLTTVIKKQTRLFGAIAQQSQLTVGGSLLPFGITLPTSKQVQQHIKDAKTFQTLVDQFSSDFGDAVSAFLQQNKQGNRLVVFVDDLDRCLPQNAITILEGLKIFLDTSPCIFIFGVDRTMVEKAVYAHYGHDPGISGREYLDKIVQHPFSVPPANGEQLKGRFGMSGLGAKDTGIIELAAAGNPRIYLRILNTWRVVSALAKELSLDKGEHEKRLLVLASAVQVRFPRLHEVCRSRPDRLQFFYNQCTEPTAESGALFIKTAPEFKEAWDDPEARRFFYNLGNAYGQASDPLQQGSPEMIRNAFNLSAATR